MYDLEEILEILLSKKLILKVGDKYLLKRDLFSDDETFLKFHKAFPYRIPSENGKSRTVNARFKGDKEMFDKYVLPLCYENEVFSEEKFSELLQKVKYYYQTEAFPYGFKRFLSERIIETIEIEVKNNNKFES